jgi:hypothetical protein
VRFVGVIIQDIGQSQWLQVQRAGNKTGKRLVKYIKFGIHNILEPTMTKFEEIIIFSDTVGTLNTNLNTYSVATRI